MEKVEISGKKYGELTFLPFFFKIRLKHHSFPIKGSISSRCLIDARMRLRTIPSLAISVKEFIVNLRSVKGFFHIY